MKKILIVSYYYSPANIIGAVRASKLSKYLLELGYDIEVVCSNDNRLLFVHDKVRDDETLIKDTQKVSKIVVRHSFVYEKVAISLRQISKRYFSSKNPMQTIDSSIPKRTYQFKKKALHVVLFFMSIIQDYDFLFQVRREIKKRKKNYDVIITTYGPLASHFVGIFMKKKYSSIKWIADFRDPIAQPTNSAFEYRINKKIEERICKKADIITAVSNGYLKEIIGNKFSEKSVVITNGYDPDDLKAMERDSQDATFSFVYTGTTYGGKRDLKPIFRVLRELIDDCQIDKNKVIFRYAGTEGEQVLRFAKQYNLESVVELHGLITRKEALNLQRKSMFLVVSTWNEKKHEGVLPGKFLEYMLLHKPIISIVSGNIKNSEITEMIADYNLGVSYESINESVDYEKLKEYVKFQYSYYKTNQIPLFEVDHHKIQKHNYKVIAEQFSELID